MIRKKSNRYLEDKRNGLSVRSMGDKNYNYVDYEPGFFKKGGLVPG